MLYRLLVWLHVVSACLWVGGILFFALVLVPVLRAMPGPQTTRVVRAVGSRFRVVGWWSVAVLVVTGALNLTFRYTLDELSSAAFWLSPFGRILSLKLTLVAAVIAVSAAHDFLGARAVAVALRDPGSEDAARLRAIASRLGRLDAILVLAIVFVAVVLVRGW